MNNKILARRLFHRLEKGYYKSEYIVLNDGYYYASIWADNEQDAIQKFNKGEYIRPTETGAGA